MDTHRHVWQGAIGGYTPQITGAGYGPAVLTGISMKHSPEDVYAGTLWGALEALDAGITTIADWAHNDQSPAHADADLRALRDSGIRGYFLYGGPGPATSDPDPPHPADARRMRDEHFSSGRYGRLRMGMALRGPAFTSADRNADDFAFARDLGLPISVHVGMAGTGEMVSVLQRYGLLGPSAPGPPTWKPSSSAATSSSAPASSPATFPPKRSSSCTPPAGTCAPSRPRRGRAGHRRRSHW